jgi:hypothetical protein
MKRIISFAAALSMIFGAASCQKENLAGKEGDSKVTFSFQLPEEAVTKANISDGSLVDEIIYSIYVGEDIMYSGKIQKKNGAFTLEQDLVTGQTYDLLFWAQKKGPNDDHNYYYNTNSLKNVHAHYWDGRKNANDENRDAFYGARIGFKATGIATSETVKLYRPFAQINFGSSPTDWEKAQPLPSDLERPPWNAVPT